MFGPLTLIARDPLVLLLLSLAVLGGLTLHNMVQALLARRLGDPAASDAGFTSPEPPVHHSLVSLLLYLALGLALPRPVPVRLTGWRAALALMSGPVTLLLTALLLLLLQRLQQLLLSGFDPLGLALGRAAYGLTQHSVFFLLPLPSLDLGRALLLAGPLSLRRGLGPLQVAGPPLAYIFWLLLALSGGLSWATEPFWRGLGGVVGLLP
ncbi:hypothetical protein [Deinococcus sp.]|uniref:hypothetical protein n=1 Tax=Deinococcus sp. TaxID=47478 RepID=UPI003C7E6555